MVDFIIQLIRDNWGAISTGLLALIVRLIEKLRDRKKLYSKINENFPDMAGQIIAKLNGKQLPPEE